MQNVASVPGLVSRSVDSERNVVATCVVRPIAVPTLFVGFFLRFDNGAGPPAVSAGWQALAEDDGVQAPGAGHGRLGAGRSRRGEQQDEEIVREGWAV